MIDDLDKTDRLIEALKASLPFKTKLSQILMGTLVKQYAELEVHEICNVLSIFYMGEEGGIMCGLDIGGTDTKTPCIVSITHLHFDRRIPLFRKINSYQRRRTKKLKQRSGHYY
jgi:hypothetical protein